MEKLTFARSRAGRVGQAADALASAVSIHMQHEENVFIVLTALEDISLGQWPKDAEAFMEHAKAAEADLKKMHREHDLIATLAGQLRKAADREGEEEVVLFCDELANHAALEEQVLYPAAVIAGRYMAMRQAPSSGEQLELR